MSKIYIPFACLEAEAEDGEFVLSEVIEGMLRVLGVSFELKCLSEG